MFNQMAEEILQTNPVYYANKVGLQLFPPFSPDPWQATFLRSKSKRIIMNTSRQVGKSTTTALKACFRAKRRKQFIIIIASGDRQSLELMKKVEEVILADPDLKSIPTNNKSEKIFLNGSRIIALPPNEKTIRGYSGASLIIVDEASRVPDEVLFALTPMLAVSGGDLMLLSTPFGRRGLFYEIWENEPNWDKYSVKATDCPRMTQDFLDEQRRLLGDFWFRQEYMGEFVELDDSAFSYDDIMNAFEDNEEALQSDFVVDDEELYQIGGYVENTVS